MTLFEKKAMLYTTKNISQRDRIKDILIQNNISYEVKIKSNQRNSFDTAMLGSMKNNQVQKIYTYYVNKEDLDKALYLIQSN